MRRTPCSPIGRPFLFPAVLAALLAVALLAQPAGAIVGGSQAAEGEHPFMASLQDREGNHFCGGSVVAERWILTAAHCSERQPADARVVVGRTDLSSPGGQVLDVTRIEVHPAYAETGTHDVALWQVDAPITSPAIPVVGLGDERHEASGAELTVAGWGTELFGSPTTPDRLKHVDVRAVADADCVTNGLNGFQPDSEICAETLLGDSCQGDSGGPLLARDAAGRPVQVGAVSYGLGCAVPGFPGVYAELNEHSTHDFLTRTIG